MTSLLLALVLSLNVSQSTMDAYAEWDRLSWEYTLPPATITEDASWMHPFALAAYAGTDNQGRAVVSFRSSLTGLLLREAIAHEAAHALMNPTGMSVDQQEEWTDSFSLCANGGTPSGTAMHSCPEVHTFFSPWHR